MGQKDFDGAEIILGNCFTLQLIISVILIFSVDKYTTNREKNLTL